MADDLVAELSTGRLEGLLEAPCETASLDFKETLELTTLAQRLQFAKDVLAMANTKGGHIVVGVEDLTRRRRGVSNLVAEALADSKRINDQLTKYCGGHITILAARHTLTDVIAGRLTFVLIYIPPAADMVPAQADGCYPDPANPKKLCWVFRKGDLYIRKGDESQKVENPADLRRRNPRNVATISIGTQSSSLADLRNPYDIAAAATREMFKGRQTEVNTLLANIDSGTHTAIFGLQRIGKTSLVNETLEDRIRANPRLASTVAFAPLDLHRIGTQHTTYRAVLQEISRVIAVTVSSRQLEETEQQFTSFSRWYERGSKREMLKGYFALIENLAKNINHRTVIFLDEFSELCLTIARNEQLFRHNPDRRLNIHPHELLVDLDLMQWFSSLLKSAEIKGKIVFVFAFRPFMAEYDAIHDLQILKLLQSITLYHLDEMAARALITEPLKDRVIVEETAVDYLYKLTSGHPYLIQYFLIKIVNSIKIENRLIITKADVSAVESEMISEGPAYDAQFKILDSDYSVEEVMDPGRAQLGSAVLAITAKIGTEAPRGWVNIEQICAAMARHQCQIEDVHSVLSQLLRAKIVEEREISGGLHFRITVPLLRKRYVRQNMYQKYFGAVPRVPKTPTQQSPTSRKPGELWKA